MFAGAERKRVPNSFAPQRRADPASYCTSVIRRVQTTHDYAGGGRQPTWSGALAEVFPAKRRAVIACSFTLRDVTKMVEEKVPDPGRREALTEKIVGESVEHARSRIDRPSGGQWSRRQSARQLDQRAAYLDAPQRDDYAVGDDSHSESS
jgi:hypothetical protein